MTVARQDLASDCARNGLRRRRGWCFGTHRGLADELGITTSRRQAGGGKLQQVGARRHEATFAARALDDGDPVAGGARGTSSFTELVTIGIAIGRRWRLQCCARDEQQRQDRKSIRLNSSHSQISYA